MNFIGLVAALAAFFSIWSGHVAVRKIESISPILWLPMSSFVVIGITFECFSLFTSNFYLSTAFGILGITVLWDALEFARQQNRIKKGHAPANPNNPRHVCLLREYSAATTLDLLKRDPIGKAVSQSEAISLITNHQLPITDYR